MEAQISCGEPEIAGLATAIQLPVRNSLGAFFCTRFPFHLFLSRFISFFFACACHRRLSRSRLSPSLSLIDLCFLFFTTRTNQDLLRLCAQTETGDSQQRLLPAFNTVRSLLLRHPFPLHLHLITLPAHLQSTSSPPPSHSSRSMSRLAAKRPAAGSDGLDADGRGNGANFQSIIARPN